jgi:hypothetical protein
MEVEVKTRSFTQISQELKELLNQPLPGGRGFQMQYHRRIRGLVQELSEAEIPGGANG